MYQSINMLTHLNVYQLQLDLYKSIRKEQEKYKNVDIDVRFLMIRSLSNLSQNIYVLGGIIYYNMR